MKWALVILAGCSFKGPAISPGAPSDGASPADGTHVDGPQTNPDAAAGTLGPPGGVDATLALWLVGDDAQHSGNTVTGWPDRGPNHLDLAVDSARTAPIWNPPTSTTAATLKLSNSRLARASGLLPLNTTMSDITLVAVVKDDTSSAFEWLLYNGTIGFDRLSISRSWNGSPMRWDFDATTSYRDSSTQSDGRAMVMTLVASVGSTVSGANHRELFVNGVATGGSAQFAAYVSTGKPLEVGDHDDGMGGDSSRNPYDGYVGEIYLASSTPQSQTELEQLETYFALRYGIALAHPYRDATGAIVWDTGSGYDTHISGLAVDPAAHLDVRAASATDGGDLLRIEAQALPVGSHLYLIGGDNNQGVAYTAGRLQRVWRFLGGTWGTAVTIDVAGPGSLGGTVALPSQGANQVTMLVDTTPGFANPIPIPMVAGANHRLTASVVLPATAYVTFAVQ